MKLGKTARRTLRRFLVALGTMVAACMGHVAFDSMGAAAGPCVGAQNNNPYLFVEVCSPLP